MPWICARPKAGVRPTRSSRPGTPCCSPPSTTGSRGRHQDWFTAFAQERRPGSLGQNLAALPRFQEAAGENARLLYLDARLIRVLAEETDRGQPPSVQESGFLKLTVTENAVAVVQRAVELAGNPGLSRANPLERHLRDVLCGRIHWPQGDAVRTAAGRAALGL